MDRVEPRELQVNLGRAIRAKRAERGFSQESFAHEVGLHRTYMGAIERGEQNVGVLNLTSSGKPTTSSIVQRERRLWK